MIVAETERLRLRPLNVEDAAFVLELLNEPSWLHFIGDKGVRTLEDARTYIATGPMAMYARLGFGLYVTERKSDGAPMGMCGLIKRDGLDDVDIGFAFLPRYWGRGYAHEAAAAVMDFGKRIIGLTRIVAITSPDNEPSARLLEKLGLRFDRMVRLSDDAKEDRLFVPVAEVPSSEERDDHLADDV